MAWNAPDGRPLRQFTEEAAAMEEAWLKAAQFAAGRVERVEMGRSDRDELQAVRGLAGDVPVVAAMQEWRQARELTNGKIIPSAEAWAARSGSTFEPIRRGTIHRVEEEPRRGCHRVVQQNFPRVCRSVCRPDAPHDVVPA